MGIRPLILAGAIAAVALLPAGCGRSDTQGASAAGPSTTSSGAKLSGRIEADGSSTVGPFVTAAAEDFQAQNSGVQVTVGISGTGGGFERFCNGETDISDASRPIKDDEEVPVCQKNGIDYTEFQVANDGIAVVVNNDNDWAKCLTVDQLTKIWGPDSQVGNWNQVDPSFPDEKLTLAGPGTDSGTFDFFTKEINGEEDASRTDYQATEDDNVIVQAVEGDKGGLGYFGLSYFEQNQGNLTDVEVDGGSGCVAPTTATVQDGSYTPLSRPLFVYVKNTSLAKPEVKAFVAYLIDNQAQIAEKALFVPLTDEQAQKSKSDFEAGTS
ncbi:MAG: PstS family phosphate ABC transporter substrate-binding protein [Gaiellaceae bacterium]